MSLSTRWKLMMREPYFTLWKTVLFSFFFALIILSVATFKFGWCITMAYEKIRPSLFTGFLTVGGFLLSLKTLILVQLRDKLYDSEEYKKVVAERQKEDPTIRRFAPLKNLGEFLLWSVFAAIFTSLVHLFLAFANNRYCALISLSMSFTTLALVFRAWQSIRASLHAWFETLVD